MATRTLAVIDRDRRASADDYTGLLEFCLGLRTGFGGIDLVLRGRAVICAVEPPPPGPDAALDRPRRYLRTLVRAGARVWADAADLGRVGSAENALLPGVVAADTNALAVIWPEYEKVWFL